MKHIKKIGLIGLMLSAFSLFWVDASYRRNSRRTVQRTSRRRGAPQRINRQQPRKVQKVAPQKRGVRERVLARSEKKDVQGWEQYKLTPEEQKLLNAEEKRTYASILSKIIISYRLLRQEPEAELFDDLKIFKETVKKRGGVGQGKMLSPEDREQLEEEYAELEERLKAGELTPEEIEHMEQVKELLSDEPEEESERQVTLIAEKRKIDLAYKLTEDVLNNLLLKNVNVPDIPQNNYSKGEAIQQLIKDGVAGQMSPANFLNSKAKSIRLILRSIEQQLQRLSQRSMNVIKKFADYFTEEQIQHIVGQIQEVWSQFEPSIAYDEEAEGFFSYAVLLYLQPAHQADPAFRAQVDEIMKLYKNTVSIFLLLITQFESIISDGADTKNNLKFEKILEKLRARLASIMPAPITPEPGTPSISATAVELFNAEFAQRYNQDVATAQSIKSEVDTLEKSSGCVQLLPNSDIKGTLARFKANAQQTSQKIVPLKNAQLRYQQMAATKQILLTSDQNRYVIEFDREIKLLEERLTHMSSLMPKIVGLMEDLESAEKQQKVVAGITTIDATNENNAAVAHKAFKAALDEARKKYQQAVQSMIPQDCQALIQTLKQQFNNLAGIFNAFDKLVIDYWNKHKKKIGPSGTTSWFLSYLPYGATLTGDWPYNTMAPIP